MNKEKQALIESALFISHKPLTLKELSEIAGLKEGKILRLLDEIEECFEKESHGIELFETNRNYELRVKPKYLDKVSHLTPYSDLSRGQLKVLALTSYKEGIKQSEVVNLIGNRAYDYVKQLEGRGLIKTEKFKRTKKLKTTQEFMRYFGIEKKEDLKEKFKEVVKEETNKEK